MKKLILFFLIGFISFGAFSNEWKLYKEVDGINIYFKNIVCEHPETKEKMEYTILKFSNSSNTDKTIQFQKQYSFNGVCQNCNNEIDPNDVILNLKPKSSIEGDCTFADYNLKLFYQYPDRKNDLLLTDFQITNIKVN